MNITQLDSTTKFVKASIPDNFSIIGSSNHFLSIKKNTLSSTSPSNIPEQQKVTIRYEPKLVAKIVKNSDL